MEAIAGCSRMRLRLRRRPRVDAFGVAAAARAVGAAVCMAQAVASTPPPFTPARAAAAVAACRLCLGVGRVVRALVGSRSKHCCLPTCLHARHVFLNCTGIRVPQTCLVGQCSFAASSASLHNSMCPHCWDSAIAVCSHGKHSTLHSLARSRACLLPWIQGSWTRRARHST